MSYLLKGTVALALSTCMAAAVSQAWSEEKKPSPSVLRHVVCFKFKADLTDAKRDEIVAAFRALPSKIDVIKGFEWGTDVGVENLSKGFTHCFFLTFADEKGRDTYLPHPAHQEFVSLVKPNVDDVFVFDYWTKD